MQPSTPVAVLGECVADAFAAPAPALSGGTSGAGREPAALGLEVRPGGGPANTAVALARLGTPTRFLGRLSADVFGRLSRARLAGSGVDVSRCPQAAEPSTLAVADLDGQGRAGYAFHAERTADWQWTRAELRAGVEGGLACLHTGSLALVRDPGAARIEQVLHEVRPRATVSIDPNVRAPLVDPRRYRERLRDWCRTADVLRVSDDDLAELAPGATPAAAADAWHTHGVRLVVVTLGARGVFASLDGSPLHVPAPRTAVVDTVGAGDAFTAGLLHALHAAGVLGGRLAGLTPELLAEAVSLGVRVAAATCAVRGANPPWAAELDTVA
ncbi:carbohydrate kinase [Streptomyces sp. WMMC500]|uniref:carbohydrate kinase family protein n=1 Tax=Streptomyces sp. WMMC500 TaxID=3015154 RepID=UPI00248C86F8|nr:carbohydrate kinase [Streptomyces sp. WMMC500]WBB58408.1 carbohydrate kinase [Streptomyces sp. WMMC500]